MQAILPGQPQAELHAVDHGYHEGQLVVAYLSGTSLILLDGPDSIIQTLTPNKDSEDDLIVVKYQKDTARIAVASATHVYVYGLREEIKGTLRWVREVDLRPREDAGHITTLSWGSDDELLVGSTTQLALYHSQIPSAPSSPVVSGATTPVIEPMWIRDIPSPLQFADLSPSASLLASVSQYDCLVKIWRRLSFEQPQFDYAYLRHPAPVTHAFWRQVPDADDVLFTTCADGFFRVWKSNSTHGLEILSLYAEIDMIASIHSRQPPTARSQSRRYAFVLDSAVLERAAKSDAADKGEINGEARHAHEYLQEIASRKPDIVVISDDCGHMSAWGIESVGCKKRTTEPETRVTPFHINHSEHVDLGISNVMRVEHSNTMLRAIALPSTPNEIAILTHHFDGRITWYQALTRDFINPAANKHRQRHLATWTGHSTDIKKVIRTASGKALISRTALNQGIVWLKAGNESLVRHSIVTLREHIHRVVLLRDGDFLACLHHECITLWDCREIYAKEIARCEYKLSQKPLCFFVLPAEPSDRGHAHLATISADMAGIVWKLELPVRAEQSDKYAPTSVSPAMKEFCKFSIGAMAQAVYVLPVDPAGSAPIASDFLDLFSHDVAMSYSATGLLRTYTARIDHENNKVDFLTTSSVETGLQNPSLGSATSIRRAALVDCSTLRLTIWDTRNGRLDHEEVYEENVQDLDWASTPDNRSSILAVGFRRHIVVYSQLRYDYVNDRPAWARIKTVRLPDAALPHPIGDSVWFGDGSLVVGTGSQLLVVPGTIDASADVSPELRVALPHRKHGSSLVGSQHGVRSYTEDASSTVTDAVAQSLNELLTQKSIPQLTSPEQISLASIIECVATVSTHSRSMDINASRFLLFWRSSLIQSHQQSSASVPSSSTMSSHAGISWREVVFAYHSSSQDILTNLILSGSNKSMSWQLAQQSRLFTWLASREMLMQYFEDVAKSAYTANDPRDPVACSLHYLALRKKQVLVGLWRMATWSREQSATMKLLRNDFSDQRWKTAAQKNAFALMGRRRFEYAAAFFLLADDLRSAIGVIANQLEDVELALAVGRVYGGDECDEVRDLVRERILRTAALRGDRWMATWGFWFLGERGRAVRALVSPLDTLVAAIDIDISDHRQSSNEEQAQSLRAKSFLNDDPALVILYEQLRSKSLQTLRGALQIQGGDESRFVIRTAGLLRRMGCATLALDLVKNWAFLRTERPRQNKEQEEESVGELPPSPSATRSDVVDPRKLLRRRSSLVVDDLGTPPPRPAGVRRLRSALDDYGFDEGQQQQQEQQAPKVKSLLDSFEEPQSQPQPQKVKSLLDSYEEQQPTKVKSLLDSYEEQQPQKVNSMLDSYTEAKPVKSMLDDFSFEQPQKATKPVSMLDGFEEPKKEEKRDGKEKGKDKKQDEKKPTTFKEPDASSILDNFGF
ncbi:hypothetical protein ANO11243_079900 [Dothideomycetidae sp. 11243]|nr:hypothetical protein ANO11243_079900 [fungal sp. No.11243]